VKVEAKEAYSDLKAAWHLDQIERLRSGERVVPPHVQLIISDLCNQDCHFCAYRMSAGFSTENFAQDGNKNPNRKIATDKAVAILDDLKYLGVQAVQFTGGGEPTVHKEHMTIFRHALALGLKCGLVTNGTKLAEGWREVYPKFSWIRVSLDAGTRETYAKIRGSREKMFATVLENTRALTRACPDTVVGIGYVVTPENYGEIVSGVRSAKWTGASYVRVSAMFSKEFMAPFEDIYETIKLKIDAARRTYEDDAFKVVDLFGNRLDDLQQHAPDYPICGYQHFNVYIGADLKVYRCCTTAYTDHGEVGDLSNQSFLEWYSEAGPKYKDFDARSCSVCQFNGKNKAINYLVGPKPLHVEFV